MLSIPLWHICKANYVQVGHFPNTLFYYLNMLFILLFMHSNSVYPDIGMAVAIMIMMQL